MYKYSILLSTLTIHGVCHGYSEENARKNVQFYYLIKRVHIEMKDIQVEPVEFIMFCVETDRIFR